MSEISRRDFLKWAGITAGGILAANTGLNKIVERTSDVFREEPLMLTPEIIDKVDVYAYLDDKSKKSQGIEISDKIKQRKELLNPNERYLEVVIRRSAYDSFVQKQAESGLSFPEWIKIHVDVMNRCLEKTNPPVEMKVVLKRILVIEDSTAAEFWDEKAYRQKDVPGSALDVAWERKFIPFSFDTDESWAIADDYRDSGGGKFWEVRHKNGKTIIGNPPGNEIFDQYYEFPEKEDSLSHKNNISFDMGLIHEWSHYLLNLPDEYQQDVHDASQRFKHFTFGSGNFSIPEISPFLAYLMRQNIKIKARNFYGTKDDRRIVWQSNIQPEKIQVTIDSQYRNLVNSHLEVRSVRLLEKSYYGNKSVPEAADRVSETNSLSFDRGLFQGDSNCWHIKMAGGRESREVFLPMAAFKMSELAGLESVNYNLIFSGYDDTGKTNQEVKLVNEADLDRFLDDSPDPYYAKMKVEGTDIWFVWFLR